MTSLFEWLSTTPPSWASETILNWENIFNRDGPADIMQFVIKETYESNATIDMRSVVGQMGHYAGQTWFDAATNPLYKEIKMRDVFSLYEKNPDYYFNGKVADGISFSSFEGKSWYSHGGGNHRTVVAKFACERMSRKTENYPLVCGVSKLTYQVDVEAWRLFSKLILLKNSSISPSVKKVRRVNRLADQQIIKYNLNFFICDYRFSQNGRCQHLNSDEFCKYAKWVILNNAVPTNHEKLLHQWTSLFGNKNRLIYKP